MCLGVGSTTSKLPDICEPQFLHVGNGNNSVVHITKLRGLLPTLVNPCCINFCLRVAVCGGHNCGVWLWVVGACILVLPLISCVSFLGKHLSSGSLCFPICWVGLFHECKTCEY